MIAREIVAEDTYLIFFRKSLYNPIPIKEICNPEIDIMWLIPLKLYNSLTSLSDDEIVIKLFVSDLNIKFICSFISFTDFCIIT